VTARAGLRAGLVLLTVLQAAGGLWGLLFPRSFYDDGPWVALLPPYNEHFVRDIGAYTLALAVLIGAAAVVLERRLVLTAMATSLTFSIAHFVFHATHLDHYALSAVVAQTATLAVAVVLPAALCIVAWRVGPAHEPHAGRAGSATEREGTLMDGAGEGVGRGCR
jgi:hypothetical protein